MTNNNYINGSIAGIKTGLLQTAVIGSVVTVVALVASKNKEDFIKDMKTAAPIIGIIAAKLCGIQVINNVGTVATLDYCASLEPETVSAN